MAFLFYLHSMCKYCGINHGMIGDVVCPNKKRFTESYVSKFTEIESKKIPESDNKFRYTKTETSKL